MIVRKLSNAVSSHSSSSVVAILLLRRSTKAAAAVVWMQGGVKTTVRWCQSSSVCGAVTLVEVVTFRKVGKFLQPYLCTFRNFSDLNFLGKFTKKIGKVSTDL